MAVVFDSGIGMTGVPRAALGSKPAAEVTDEFDWAVVPASQ
jgi:hypothetical protein